MRHRENHSHPRSWKAVYHSNMNTLQSAPCISCRKRAFVKLLLQKRQIRGMREASQRPAGLPKEVLWEPATSVRVEDVLEPWKPVKSQKVSSKPVKEEGSSSDEKPATNEIVTQTAEITDGSKKRKSPEEGPSDPAPPKDLKKPRTNGMLEEGPEGGKKASKERQQPANPQPQTQQLLQKPKQVQAIASPSQSESQGSAGRKKPTAAAAAASKISRAWPTDVGAPRTKGLFNPMNYCYRRSTLQNLLRVPQFLNLLRGDYHTHCKAKSCVVCALRHLAITYHCTPNDTRRAVTALDQAVKSTGRKSDPSWTSFGSQDDAQLFLVYLLGVLENGKGIPKAAFSAIYKIKHRISWTCAACHKEHQNDASNPAEFGLNLAITGKSLDACIDAAYQEGQILIRCDGGCEANAKRQRHHSILDAPEVLSIQLKRFNFERRSTTPSKNSKHVDIPLDLDLTRWSATPSSSASKPLKYKLQAVILQAGGLRSGHYISYIREDTNSNKASWKDISDESVSVADLAPLRQKHHWSPYIMTYVRVFPGDEGSGAGAAVGGPAKRSGGVVPQQQQKKRKSGDFAQGKARR